MPHVGSSVAQFRPQTVTVKLSTSEPSNPQKPISQTATEIRNCVPTMLKCQAPSKPKSRKHSKTVVPQALKAGTRLGTWLPGPTASLGWAYGPKGSLCGLLVCVASTDFMISGSCGGLGLLLPAQSSARFFGEESSHLSGFARTCLLTALRSRAPEDAHQVGRHPKSRHPLGRQKSHHMPELRPSAAATGPGAQIPST